MKVSVITASYNSGEKILRCIESVNCQTYDNLEHIFVDGGSIDDTVVKITQSRRPNQVISEPDDGIYNALNKGIQLATGDLIFFLHSDDVFACADTLTKLVENFRTDPDLAGVYGNITFVRRFGSCVKEIRVWNSSNFKIDSLAYGWMPPHTSLLISKKVFADIGLFSEKFKVSGDYEFLLRFLYTDPKIRYVNENVVVMDIGGVSTKLQFGPFFKKFKEDILALRMNNSSHPIVTAVFKRLRKLKQFVG